MMIDSALEWLICAVVLAGIAVSLLMLIEARRVRRWVLDDGLNGSLLALANAGVVGEALRLVGQVSLSLMAGVLVILPSRTSHLPLVYVSKLGILGGVVAMLLASLYGRRIRRQLVRAELGR